MPELAVAASDHYDPPTVLPKELDHRSDLHGQIVASVPASRQTLF
jgi:hypothetical protein